MRPSSMKSTRSACASGRAGRCSETSTAHGRCSTQVEERVGGRRVELRGRLVEQQQPWTQRERRRERHALQLAARTARRSRGRRACSTPTSRSASSTRGQISAGGVPMFSSPNATSFATLRHHDLVLGILEDRRDGAGELARSRLARVDTADDDAAREQCRRGSAARARRARAAASTCPSRTGRAARRARRRRSRSDTSSQHGRAVRVREAQAVDDRYSHSAPTTTMPTATRRARRGRDGATAAAARACGRRVRSRAPPSPRRGSSPRSSEPARSGESRRTGPSSTSRPRSATRRSRASRSSSGTSRVASADGERRAPRPAGRREQAVVVEEQRVHGEREPDRDEPQRPGRDRSRSSSRRHVELPEHRDRRPGPERMRADLLDERREQEHGEPGDERADRGTASGVARARAARATSRTSAISRDRPGVRREQRRDGERGQQRRLRAPRSERDTSARADRARAASRPLCRAASR